MERSYLYGSRMIEYSRILDFISGIPGYADFAGAKLDVQEPAEGGSLGYKVTLPGAAEASYYLKLVKNDEHFEFTNQLLEWISERNIFASPPYKRLPDLSYEDTRYRSYIRPLFLPAATHPGPGQIPLILESLRLLHDALKAYPRQKEALGKSELVQQQLEEIRQAFLSGSLYHESFGLSPAYREWLRANEAWLHFHFDTFRLDFFHSEDAQCLHGDLHPRNMLFAPGEKLMFIDFDDSYKSFSSPLYDIAYIYARLAETSGMSDEEFSAMLATHYGKSFRIADVRNWSKQIFRRQVLMVMYNALYRKKEKTTAEFEKFKYRIDCYENGSRPSPI